MFNFKNENIWVYVISFAVLIPGRKTKTVKTSKTRIKAKIYNATIKWYDLLIVMAW